MAIGDAYGIGFEFVDKDEWSNNGLVNDLSKFYQHPLYSNLIPGQYTDDTQRALANTMVICHKDFLNPLEYTKSYIEEFKASPRDGYSRGFQALIESCDDGQQLLDTVSPTKNSNGSIMGVAPLGYLENISDVMRAAAIQAMTTHGWRTVPYAQMIAATAHYFLYDIGPKDELTQFLFLNIDLPNTICPMIAGKADECMFASIIKESEYEDLGVDPCSMSAKSTALHALYAIVNYDNLADMLTHCIDVSGDTDSLAAISMALGSVSTEIENNLPQHFYDTIENGSRGRDYIKQLNDVINNVYFPNTWIAQSLKT